MCLSSSASRLPSHPGTCEGPCPHIAGEILVHKSDSEYFGTRGFDRCHRKSMKNMSFFPAMSSSIPINEIFMWYVKLLPQIYKRQIKVLKSNILEATQRHHNQIF